MGHVFKRFDILVDVVDALAVPGYTGNILVIGSCLEYIDLPTGQTDIKSTLVFLEGHGLLTLKTAEDLIVVELSASGLDAARELIRVAGVCDLRHIVVNFFGDRPSH